MKHYKNTGSIKHAAERLIFEASRINDDGEVPFTFTSEYKLDDSFWRRVRNESREVFDKEYQSTKPKKERKHMKKLALFIGLVAATHFVPMSWISAGWDWFVPSGEVYTSKFSKFPVCEGCGMTSMTLGGDLVSPCWRCGDDVNWRIAKLEYKDSWGVDPVTKVIFPKKEAK